MADTTAMAEWIHDAVECLKEYRQYSESMRAIGRWFSPVGKKGHSVDSVIAANESIAAGLPALLEHSETRCPVCNWKLDEDGCNPQCKLTR